MKTAILISAITLALLGCSRSEQPTAEQGVAGAAATKAPDKPTADQMLDAMVRSYGRITNVCVDGLRANAFFVQFAPVPDGEDPETLMHDWYLTEKVEFYQAANNTWFITDISSDKFIRVYPDVTNMQCKGKHASAS